MLKIILLTSLLSSSLYAKDLFETVKAFEKGKVHTTAVLVLRSDKVLGEYSSRAGILDQKFLLWSISKTISSLIIGRAIDDGYLSLKDIVLHDIKVKDLLQMSSGLDWDESYEEAPFKSNVVRMLYGPESSNMGEYVASIPVKYPAGTRFKYSSGDSNLLQLFLKKKLKDDYLNYPWKVLFDPLGIKATFETDKNGIFAASSYVYMSPRDLSKVALLIMQKGKWGKNQLISENYIKEMLNASSASTDRSRSNESDLNYGYQIWLNTRSSTNRPPLKDLAENSIILLGHSGQIVGIFPDDKLIILRSGYDRERLDKNQFFKEILSWAKKQN